MMIYMVSSDTHSYILHTHGRYMSMHIMRRRMYHDVAVIARLYFLKQKKEGSKSNLPFFLNFDLMWCNVVIMTKQEATLLST